MEFMESKYLYLGLMLFSLSYPLAQSFERRITLYKNWKAIFAGTAVMMLLFIPWDIWFTDIGVWWFRDDYITGWKIFLLPIEEWMFFIVVPYACIFIYEVLIYFIKRDLLLPVARPFFGVLSVLLALLAVYFFPNYYTSITFGLTALHAHYWPGLAHLERSFSDDVSGELAPLSAGKWRSNRCFYRKPRGQLQFQRNHKLQSHYHSD